MLSTVKHRGFCLLENWQPITKFAEPSLNLQHHSSNAFSGSVNNSQFDPSIYHCRKGVSRGSKSFVNQ
jgi:hypothetical protein